MIPETLQLIASRRSHRAYLIILIITFLES